MRGHWCFALAAILALLGVCVRPAGAAPLTLAEVVDRALAYAPSVSMATADSDASEARMREQRAPLYPALTADTEYYQAPGYNTVVTNRGLSAGLITLNYTMWDWGRREAQYRAARYLKDVAQFGVAAARAQIAFEARVAYYDLQHQRDAERELAQNLDRLSRYVTTIEALRVSGRAITNDVLKIRSARDAAELMLSAARNATLRSSANLGSLMGDFNGGDIAIVESADLPSLPQGDLAQTPQMQAALRAISSSKLQVDAAKAARLPTFDVTLTTGAMGIDPPTTVNHNYGASYDGIISMPLFDGGAISARIDQAKAKLNSDSAQYRQTNYLLARRLKDAEIRYEEARQALAIMTRSQPTADDAFAMAWTRFLGGGGATLLEVLDAYEQAEQLRLDHLSREFAAREAVAETSLLYGRIQ